MQKVSFKVFIMSDSYVGFNKEKNFSIEIKKKEKETE